MTSATIYIDFAYSMVPIDEVSSIPVALQNKYSGRPHIPNTI